MKADSEHLWPPDRGILGELISRQARRLGEKVFLYFQDREYTYAQIDHRSDQVAQGLRALGITQGDKVGVMLPNCPEFLFTWFGIAKLGAVEVPVNIALRGPGLTHVLRHSDAKGLVVDQSLVQHVATVQDEVPGLELCVIRSPQSGETPVLSNTVRLRPTTVAFADLLKHGDAPLDVRIHHSDLMSIIYTSGTTGPAKGVMLPHHYALWHAQQRIRLMRLTQDDLLYSCLPLFHINAKFITILSAWLAGGQVALGERFSASHFWDDIRRYGATEFNFIGSMIRALYNQPPRPDDNQHRVHLAMGAPVPPEIYGDFERRFGVKILEGFGMTECSPGLFSPYDEARRNSMGKAISGHKAAVVDEDDREVGPGQIGELVFHPETPYSMLLGYHKQPEETLKAFRNLWFHTGDYVYRDSDGYFFFVDRKKDAIRRRGENISAFEVESVVSSHPLVAESAAISVPSTMGEDDVKVVVVLQSGAQLEPADLIRWCHGKLAYFAVPRYVEFMESLPKTATLRVEKYRLRENWQTAGTWDREAAGLAIGRDGHG